MDWDYRTGTVGALVDLVKLRREGHPISQSYGPVVYLSRTRILKDFETSLLQRELSFIPKGLGGATWNRLEAESGLSDYHRRLRLVAFFGEEGGGLEEGGSE